MIDTHCHLTDPRLYQQLDAVLQRASAAGVEKIITIGTSVSDAESAIELCEGRSSVRCAVGIHPNYCHEAELADIQLLRGLQQHPAVLALGEMGLDYHYDFAPKDRQRQFFQAQLDVARDTGRNVIVHCRDAVADALAILRGFPNRAVFHCFTGTIEDAQAILAAGHWISYTGAATFKKNDALRACINQTPRDRLMVETDAPYLSPEPFRSQKVNEPALVIHTAAVVARTWGVSIEEVDRVTTANARVFFDV